MLKVIEVAEEQIGYHEGANNYNKYAPDLEQWYGWNIQSQPWCDIFVDWCFVTAYGMELASKLLCEPVGSASASCAVSMSRFQSAGQFTFDCPRVGDQVFFGAGGGSHTGLVVSVDGNSFETIEGNTSDGVYRRRHSVGDGYTYGFGHPDYSLVDEGAQETTEPERELYAVVVQLPKLRRGDIGYYVQEMQSQLVLHKCAPENTIRRDGTCDGEFGDGTERALNRFKATRGLEQNGVCDGQCWTELINK